MLFSITRVKFIKIHPGWFIFHLILDSVIHLALFFRVFEIFISFQNLTFCVFTLADVIITLISITIYCCSGANKGGVIVNEVFIVFFCVLEMIHIFCLYNFYKLPIYENLRFFALVVLGILKIGHCWIFLYWLKRMLAQQKNYRIALQRFADEIKISVETFEKSRNGNEPNNSV